MGISPPKLGEKASRRLVPTGVDGRSADGAFRAHLGRGGGIDGDTGPVTWPEESLSVRVEFAPSAGHCEFVRKGQVEQHISDIPAFTRRSQQPIGVAAPFDKCAEHGVLLRQIVDHTGHDLKLPSADGTRPGPSPPWHAGSPAGRRLSPAPGDR